jgi:histidine triad (HIT) family protein
MPTECLFCRLVHGELPSHRVYEDDAFIVLLALHPINPGHALVVPKAHIASFYDAEDALYASMMLLVKRMALVIKAVFEPLQVVMSTSGVGNRHVHVHVMPVYSMYDIVPREILERQEASPAPEQELARVAQDFAHYIATHPS